MTNLRQKKNAGSSDWTESKNELTPEKLRTYKGFENSTEEQAEKQIHFIKKMARVIYHLYQEDK